jgi:hypothetical protein
VGLRSCARSPLMGAVALACSSSVRSCSRPRSTERTCHTPSTDHQGAAQVDRGGCQRACCSSWKSQGCLAFPFMSLVLPYWLGSWKYFYWLHDIWYVLPPFRNCFATIVGLSWTVVLVVTTFLERSTSMWLLVKYYMLMLVLRAIIGKQAPPFLGGFLS